MSAKKTTKAPRTTKAAKKAKAPKAAKAARAKKTAPVTGKKMSLIDAAAVVLADGEPRNAKQMIAAISAKGLWSSPAGKTPHATLYADIIKEIATKGKDARFKKTEPGKFTVAA
jgi:HB1, ASXL, restriction endonuclease HTH domain